MAFYDIPTARAGIVGRCTYNGVVGDIPNYTAVPVTGLTPGGLQSQANANQSILDSFFNSLSAGQRMVIPPGTFSFNTFSRTANQSGYREASGSGDGVTNMICWAGNAVNFTTGTQWGDVFNPTSTVVSGITRGSTSLTLASGAGFVGDKLCRLYIPADNTTPVVYGRGSFERFHTIYIPPGGVSGNVVTLFQPLPCDFPVTAGARLEQPQYATMRRIGLSKMSITGQEGYASTFGVIFNETVESWINEVSVSWPGNYGITISGNQNVHLRKVRLDGSGFSGPNRANLLVNTNTNSLFEHSYSVNGGPSVEANQCNLNNAWFGFFTAEGQFNINHGPQNAYSYYEACDSEMFHADGYFGGTENDTWFRSRVRAFFPANPLRTYAPDAFTYPGLMLKRFTRRPTVIGNEIETPGHSTGYRGKSYGLPNINNPFTNGDTVDNTLGTWWPDHKYPGVGAWEITVTVTTRADNSNCTFTCASSGDADWMRLHLTKQIPAGESVGTLEFAASFAQIIHVSSVIGLVGTMTYNSGGTLPDVGQTFKIYPGHAGFQEQDNGVASTELAVGNSYVTDGGIPTAEALPSGDLFRDSLLVNTKPGEFGSLQWPPFNSSVYPGNNALDRTPAGYRYIHGVWPDEAGGGGLPTSNPIRSARLPQRALIRAL